MKKIIFPIFIAVASSAMAMEQSQLPLYYSYGFATAHYNDFLNCYFEGKHSAAAVETYMNFCMRDKMWSLYKTFLEEGGSRVIDIANNPTTGSREDFLLMKRKLEQLKRGIDEASVMMNVLEGQRSVSLDQIEKNEKKTVKKSKKKGKK